MSQESRALEALDLDQLDHAGGGVSAKTAGKWAVRGVKAGLRVTPLGLGIAAAGAGYAGYESYKKGNSWGTILKDAAIGTVW